MKYLISSRIEKEALLRKNTDESTMRIIEYQHGIHNKTDEVLPYYMVPLGTHQDDMREENQNKLRAFFDIIKSIPNHLIKTKEELSHYTNAANTNWNPNTSYLVHPCDNLILIPQDIYKEYIILEMISEIIDYIASNMSLKQICVGLVATKDLESNLTIPVADVFPSATEQCSLHQSYYNLLENVKQKTKTNQDVSKYKWISRFPDIITAVELKAGNFEKISDCTLNISASISVKELKAAFSGERSLKIYVKYIKEDELPDIISDSVYESEVSMYKQLCEIGLYSSVELNIPAVVASSENVYVYAQDTPGSEILGELDPNSRVTIQYVSDNYLCDPDSSDMVRVVANGLEGYVSSSCIYVSLTEKKYTQEQWLILGLILFHQYNQDYDLFPKPRMVEWKATDEIIAEHYLRVEPKGLSCSDIQKAFFDEYACKYYCSCFESAAGDPYYYEENGNLGIITGIGGPGRDFRIVSIVTINENEILFSVSVKYPWKKNTTSDFVSLYYEDGKWKCGMFFI